MSKKFSIAKRISMEDIDDFVDIEVDDDFVDKDMAQIISDNEFDPLYDDSETIAVALQLAGYGKLADLEAKLAEAQKTIEIQKMSNDALQEENLDYRYDITDTAYEQAKEMAKNWESQYQEEIKELKAKLAEKEEELKKSRNEYWEVFDKLDEKSHRCEIATLENIMFEEKLKQANQDKISFAVEQLEKVKELIRGKERFEIECGNYSIVLTDDVIEQINNQIKQLKEGK